MDKNVSSEKERIIELTIKIFGSERKAYRWLESPKKKFSGLSPLEMLRTKEGLSEVEEVLKQFEEGFTF